MSGLELTPHVGLPGLPFGLSEDDVRRVLRDGLEESEEVGPGRWHAAVTGVGVTVQFEEGGGRRVFRYLSCERPDADVAGCRCVGRSVETVVAALSGVLGYGPKEEKSVTGELLWEADWVEVSDEDGRVTSAAIGDTDRTPPPVCPDGPPEWLGMASRLRCFEVDDGEGEPWVMDVRGGVGPVRFGMSRAEVVAVVGPPDRVECEDGDDTLVYGRLGLEVGLDERGRCDHLQVTRPDVGLGGVPLLYQPLGLVTAYVEQTLGVGSATEAYSAGLEMTEFADGLLTLWASRGFVDSMTLWGVER